MSWKQIAIRVPVLAAAMLAPVWADDSDVRRCGNSSLRGSYAFLANGTTFAALGLPAPLLGTFASKGVVTYDGQGNVSLTATSSFHGFVQGPATVTGSYQVSADCSFTSKLSNGATFFGAIVDSGRELFVLQTNTGTANIGTAASMGRRGESNDDGNSNGCTARSLAGSYGFRADGGAGAPTLPGTAFGPLVGAGVVKLNADGTFLMMAQRSVAGVIDPVVLPLSGKFTVGAACAVNFNFDVGFHFEGTAAGNEILFVETDPGTAVTVQAKRQ